MFNTEIVSKYLQQIGQYPHVENEDVNGLKIMIENGCLICSGSQSDLIDMADLFVSLALSGENNGQHCHIDTTTLVAEDSPIRELILERLKR